MALKKFGQYVNLKVTDKKGNTVFEADDLRVDFDVRHINGFSRAKFSIYNLLPSTVSRLSSGEKYVTLSTSLHDKEPTVIANQLYISNALEEKKVPDAIFSMFCYSKIYKLYLQKPIEIYVTVPSLKKVIESILGEVDFSGKIIYKTFPDEVLNYVPDKNISKHTGSAMTCLERLATQYGFNFYTEGDNIVIAYKPDSKNVAGTDLRTSTGEITLDTRNMRGNPKLGPATIAVHSNLDEKIRPSSIINITKLLTAGTSVDEEALQVASKLLEDSVAGSATYQVLSVQHKGSNYTKEWSTHLFASNPTGGTDMPTTNWFN